jgi:hypothetical protein
MNAKRHLPRTGPLKLDLVELRKKLALLKQGKWLSVDKKSRRR